MRVGVAYADASQQVWLRVDVHEGITARQAIEQSGLLRNYPEISLDTQKIGIFGKIVSGDTVVSPGDRIEIYRPITCDPTLVPRRDGLDED